MAGRLQSTLQRKDEVSYLRLAGVVDEDNDLAELGERVPGGPLIVDLAEVERINSCGVRDWVDWLARVERGGAKPIFVQCSPSIVVQVNLVHNFTGGGAVRSFYAPYFCPRCDREKLLLIHTRDASPGQPFRAPPCRCDECDGPMDFDDMEDSYFAFLSNPAKLAVDPRVEEAIAEFTPADTGPRLRARTRSSSNPSFSPIMTPTGGSGSGGGGTNPTGPSLSAFRRTTSGSHPVVKPSGTTGQHPAVATGPQQPVAPRPAPSPAPAGRGVWIALALLVGSALALAAWLFAGAAPK